jgi:hypothetical protein
MEGSFSVGISEAFKISEVWAFMQNSRGPVTDFIPVVLVSFGCLDQASNELTRERQAREFHY